VAVALAGSGERAGISGRPHHDCLSSICPPMAPPRSRWQYRGRHRCCRRLLLEDLLGDGRVAWSNPRSMPDISAPGSAARYRCEYRADTRFRIRKADPPTERRYRARPSFSRQMRARRILFLKQVSRTGQLAWMRRCGIDIAGLPCHSHTARINPLRAVLSACGFGWL
jgi:hypothetical protein